MVDPGRLRQSGQRERWHRLTVNRGVLTRDVGAAPATAADASNAGAQVIPFRPGTSAIARALVTARKDRGQSRRLAAARVGLPVRYLCAFETDTAVLVFRSPAAANLFLAEYARYLGVDPRGLTSSPAHHRRPGSSERAPPGWAPMIARTPGKGGRTPRAIGGGASREGRDRRFPMVALFLAFALVATVGFSVRIAGSQGRAGEAATGETRAMARAARARPHELPRGGRTLFPDYRVVALYGSPLSHRLGRLGLGPPSFAAEALREQARDYQSTRPVLPALELVATVAGRHPGPDGSYALRLPDQTIDAYLKQVRTLRGLLIIDVQPGRRSFQEEVSHYEAYLKQPDVGFAIDPEWRVASDLVPGRVVGSVSAEEVNAVIDYLARIVRQYDLPQKLLVVHQFRPSMVRKRHTLHTPPEVALTFDIDGVGGRAAKIAKDVGLMPPSQILSLEPAPDLVIYQ
jgi:helix-turn-helix protein